MKKVFVVGIAGGTSSGKTTFSNLLEQALCDLKVKNIHMDNYFKPEQMRPYAKAHVTQKMYVDNNHPTTVDLPQLEKDLADAIDENEYDVIIVEGFLTLYDDEIYDMLDLKLYIECRADERIVRRIKRGIERGRTFDQVAEVYLDMVRYRHDEYVESSKWRADLILNGSTPSAKAFVIITDTIRASI